jgi:hypothetical protein
MLTKHRRWNSEATDILKEIFLELMVDDPPAEEGALHPDMFDKDWKRRTFIEHFEPMGYTVCQYYRNYPKCLVGFEKEYTSLEGPMTAPTYRGMEWLTQGWVDGVPSLGWETTLAFLIMPVLLLVLGQSRKAE